MPKHVGSFLGQFTFFPETVPAGQLSAQPVTRRGGGQGRLAMGPGRGRAGPGGRERPCTEAAWLSGSWLGKAS